MEWNDPDTLFNTTLNYILKINRDLFQLYLQKLPLNIFYKLVECSIQLENIDKFATLIKYWPSTLFDAAKIRNSLKKDHYAVIFNKIKENTVENVTEFDFVGKSISKFGHQNKSKENLFTELFLNFIFEIKKRTYPKRCSAKRVKTKSYQDALRSAVLNKEVAQKSDCREYEKIIKYSRKTMTMRIELVVEYENLDRIISVLTLQEEFIKLKIVCYYFRGIISTNICKILQMADKAHLLSIDLGFSVISNKQTVDVCEALGKCVQLTNLTWNYGDLNWEKFEIISNCISMMSHLNSLNLSLNYKLFSKIESFATQLPFESITSLILTGCGINKHIIKYFSTSINLFMNLQFLDLSSNQNLRKAGKDLVSFIQAISCNIQYLNIMDCNLKSKTLFSICRCFVGSKQLNVLKIEQIDSTEEYFRKNLYPCLKDALFLKEFPPVIVNNQN